MFRKECAALIGAVVVLAAPAIAGEYHNSGQLVCSDCHTMHASKDGQTWAPTEGLLKYSSTNALCLSCHDGTDTSAPDVIASGTASAPNKTVSTPYINKFGSSGGFFQSDYQSAPNPAGHDILQASVTAPGGGPTLSGMNCATCHEPHGNDNYRNLVANPGGTTTSVSVRLGQDVIENIAVNAQSPNPSTAYDSGNVAYIHNTSPNTGLSTWCASCHPNFHENVPNKHKSDEAISYTHWTQGTGIGFGTDIEDGTAGIPRVRFEAAAGTTAFSGATSVSSSNRVVCVSCHKAHGSKYDSCLVWPYYTQNETGKDRTAACGQCHDKGS